MTLRQPLPPSDSERIAADQALGVPFASFELPDIDYYRVQRPDSRIYVADEEASDEPAELELTAPHKIYVLDAREHPEKVQLAELARFVGWGYLVLRDGRVAGLSETAIEPESGNHESGRASWGRGVEVLAESMRLVDLDDDLDGFELRVLRIPSRNERLLWLHAPGEDFVIPVDGGSLPERTGLFEASRYLRNVSAPEPDEHETGLGG